ncbi:MAG: hypothetical protein LBS02_19720, partial [Hungatella sp.]|nr:hypothetical protein [Hungatella sp.]
MGDRAGSSPVTRMIRTLMKIPEFLVNTGKSGILFLHYRKLRKQSKIVYNGFEIKNSIAKERSIDFAMTLYMR